jgi:acyl transferase domain-containing protein
MSEHSLVFMFSGQGSQYYQMGRIFFDGNATFRNTFHELNNIAAPLLGRSLIDVLYTDGKRKDEPFDRIEHTSAAIFIVEYALASALLDDGLRPDCLLASSMGIYAAAAIAGAVEPREALEVLLKLTTKIQAQHPKGSMIAVFASPRLHRELAVLHKNSDIAAVNFDSHFVISTTNEHIEEITAVLLRENVAFQQIAVSYPFHSRWIEGARDVALQVFGTLRHRQPSIPLVCCAQTTTVEVITPEVLWNSLRRPIEFKRTVAELEKRGPHQYVDVGPAGTLATFLKYALPSSSASTAYSVLSPFGAELKNYQRLTSGLGRAGNLPANAEHQSLYR